MDQTIGANLSLGLSRHDIPREYLLSYLYYVSSDLDLELDQVFDYQDKYQLPALIRRTILSYLSWDEQILSTRQMPYFQIVGGDHLTRLDQWTK